MSIKATSFDVALLAGVSQPTVSRALRRGRGVSADTVKRVLEAADALNYRPDKRGVELRSGSTSRIATVILGDPHAPEKELNPFYMALLAAVGRAAARRQLDLLVSFQTQPSSFNANFRKDGVADAIIVIGTARNVQGWRFFADAHRGGEPIVCWGSPANTLPTIRSDNRAGSIDAVRHLLRRGRRHIAYLGPGWRRQRAYRERREGYRIAMDDAGLPILEAPIARGPSRQAQGARSSSELLDIRPDIDAIFAASDPLALGAIKAILQRGRGIPEDIAVIGFDGVGYAHQSLPALTTVEQDVDAAGERLIDAITAIRRGDAPDLHPIVPRLRVLDSA